MPTTSCAALRTRCCRRSQRADHRRRPCRVTLRAGTGRSRLLRPPPLRVVHGVADDPARNRRAAEPRLDERSGTAASRSTFARPSVAPSRCGETTACVMMPTSAPSTWRDAPVASAPPDSRTTLASRSRVASRSRSSAARAGNVGLAKSTDQPRPHSNGDTPGSYSTPPMMNPPSIRNRSSASIPITRIPDGAPASISASHSSRHRARSTHSSNPSSAVYPSRVTKTGMPAISRSSRNV